MTNPNKSPNFAVYKPKYTMNVMKQISRKALLLILGLATVLGTQAAEVVYRIVEFNKQTGEFILSASGQVPQGAWAYFENEYGATSGNRYNQIPRNRQASLFLKGWQGCTIKYITFSLCSNNKAGQLGYTISDNDTPLYTQRPADFASDQWFGTWVSKDLGVYVDIEKRIDVPAFTTDSAFITLQGGTAEGSVYVNAITIHYDAPTDVVLESPLGWSYEKLSKKSKISEGDECMLFRNGCAAADIDGMETSHYLDAVSLPTTTNVTQPDVLRFKLHQTDVQGQWTLTDQYGRTLGATGKQALAWNEGSTQWNITLGYEGASITNANTTYGTLRFNAPAETYARFNVYTSSSLPLPFLYRKVKQQTPIVARSLTFAETTQTVDLNVAHIALKPVLSPTSITDQRICWTSSNPLVATVNGGYVTLNGTGYTNITASTVDGGATATFQLHVVDNSTGIQSQTIHSAPSASRKHIQNNRVVITTSHGVFDVEGKKISNVLK